MLDLRMQNIEHENCKILYTGGRHTTQEDGRILTRRRGKFNQEDCRIFDKRTTEH
jgi:hypothetical protein